MIIIAPAYTKLQHTRVTVDSTNFRGVLASGLQSVVLENEWTEQFGPYCTKVGENIKQSSTLPTQLYLSNTLLPFEMMATIAARFRTVSALAKLGQG